MGKKYVTRCIVKRNGKQYKKGAVIEGLSAKEIEQGFAQNWLTSVGFDDDPESDVPATPEKKKPGKAKPGKAGSETTERDALIEKAAAAGITVTGEMTNEEIQALLEEPNEAA